MLGYVRVEGDSERECVRACVCVGGESERENSRSNSLPKRTGTQFLTGRSNSPPTSDIQQIKSKFRSSD